MKKISVCTVCLLLAIFMMLPIAATGTRDVSAETTMAVDLRELGLFNGVSETNFDLERTPTRVEVIVMLIRILGKEAEMQNGEWTHPFTDVPEWADKYVGYAYENGLTQGVSATKFGVGNASAATYLTFMLRALGYSDQNNLDFSWSDPYDLAKEVGILPELVNIKEFWRADIVTISYAALGVELKDSDMTLGEKLISANVFTTEAYMEYFKSEKFVTGNSDVGDSQDKNVVKELSASEVYEKCSSAVFYIEVYDENEIAFASGSGFFVDKNGIAVTNYHVIEGASYAKIITSDDREYDVIGIYDYNETQDWAILEINGTEFDFLEISQTPVKVGDNIYAIGSPIGFDDTITSGIVSNEKRTIGHNNYIQISAPISHGSSGGALLNTEGQVVGITSAGIDIAQNLNFALPISYIENADISEYTPLKKEKETSNTSLEEINNASIKYEFSQQSVSLKEGKEVEIDFSYELGNTDIKRTTIWIQTQDESIARAYFKTTGSFPWKMVIIGVGEGQTTIKIWNTLTDETTEIEVNVLDNKVYGDVLFYPEEYKHTVYAGESNTFKISMIKYNIPEDIEISYAAQVQNGSKAKVSWIMVNGEVLLKVTGLSAGTTSIVFTNTLNKKTLSVPLTVYPSYKQNLDLLKECVAKTGEYDKTNDMYTVSRYDEEENVVYTLAYKKSEDKIFFVSVLETFGKPMSITVEVTDGQIASGAVVLDECVGAFEVNPRTFDENEKINFSMLVGDKKLQALLQNGINLNAGVLLTLYGCDEYILSEYDLYFEDFGYSRFNRRFHY